MFPQLIISKQKPQTESRQGFRRYLKHSSEQLLNSLIKEDKHNEGTLVMMQDIDLAHIIG